MEWVPPTSGPHVGVTEIRLRLLCSLLLDLPPHTLVVSLRLTDMSMIHTVLEKKIHDPYSYICRVLLRVHDGQLDVDLIPLPCTHVSSIDAT